MSTLNARIKGLHGTDAEWKELDNKTNFVPDLGEIIIYDTDDLHVVPRIKLGDGVTSVSNLRFVSEDALSYVSSSYSDNTYFVDSGKIEKTTT